MRGTLDMQSAPGTGTTIAISLPCALQADDGRNRLKILLKPDKPAADIPLQGDIAVLLVEDTPANQAVMLAQLEALGCKATLAPDGRSEEHTSELQSLMRISYAVFCLKKKNTRKEPPTRALERDPSPA